LLAFEGAGFWRLLEVEFLNKNWRALFFLLSAVLIATALAHLPGLYNGFVNWDDPLYVRDNFLIRHISLDRIWKFLFAFRREQYPVASVFFSYALDYIVWKGNPFGYHLTNLLLHISITGLVFWFLHLLSKNLLVPLVGSLLFGLHPLHVESVAWITERKDLNSTIFFVLALILYLFYRRRGRSSFYILSVVSLALSLLAKPMAITLPLLLLLYDYAFHPPLRKRDFLNKTWYLLPIGMVSAYTLYARYCVGYSSTEYPGMKFPGSLLLAARSIPFYFKKFLWPSGLSAFYPRLEEPSVHEPVYIGSILFVAALLLLMYLLRRSSRRFVFGMGFYFISLLPVMQFVSLGPYWVADRYTYFPSIGLFYLAGEGLAALWRWNWLRPAVRKSLIIASVAVVGALLGVLTWQRTGVWKDGVSLWSDIAAKYPQSPIPWANLAGAYLHDEKDAEAARRYYEKALACDPTYRRALVGLGDAIAAMGDYEGALEKYEEAARMAPEVPGPHLARGITYMKMGKIDKAIAAYKQALTLLRKIDPKGGALVFYDLALAYERRGQTKLAIENYKEALRQDEGLYEGWLNLGSLYYDSGEFQLAAEALREAVRLNPQDAEVRLALANVYGSLENWPEAIREYRRTLSLMEPEDPRRRTIEYLVRDLSRRFPD